MIDVQTVSRRRKGLIVSLSFIDALVCAVCCAWCARACRNMVCFLVLVFFEFLNTALACGDTLTVLSSIFCLCIKHGFLYHIKSNLRVKEEIISLYTSVSNCSSSLAVGKDIKFKMNALTKTRIIFQKLNIRYYNDKVGIIGVPFDKGQKKEGVARGPEVIRAARVIEELKTLELDVRDYGDIVYDAKDINDISNMSELGHVASCTSRLSEQIRQVLRDGRQALTIGGDHSLSIGTIDGHVKEKGDVAVIWVDAHADLNTNKTSESGNVHGMPVALLTSELADYWPYLPGMDWQVPMLSIRNVAYIGLRSVDRYERLVIEKFGITAFGMEDIERYGIHNVTHMALNKIDSHNSKSLHVSFDIDALDPLEAPSTGTPVRGGLSLREAIHLMEEIYRTRRLSAIDLVEVNPQIGTKQNVEITVEAAIHIIQAALGYTRRGLKLPTGITDMPLQTFQ